MKIDEPDTPFEHTVRGRQTGRGTRTRTQGGRHKDR